MDIDKYILQKAPKYNDNDPHDMAYANALRKAYGVLSEKIHLRVNGY